MSVAHFVDRLVADNAPFACWSSGNGDFQAIIDRKPRIVRQLRELNNARGFVFAPFEASEHKPIILLQPETYLHNNAEIESVTLASRGEYQRGTLALTSVDSSTTENHRTAAEDCHITPDTVPHNNGVSYHCETDFDTYKTYVSRAIEELKNSNLYKVVLSKITDKSRQEESIGDLLQALQNANPDAFVYVVNLPEQGLWLGATPETLLHSDGKMATVMSLAGTQPLRSDHDYRWRAKEIEEQAFVSRYTVDTLNRYGVSHYQTTGPEDCETSAVTHLKTTFHFPIDAIAGRLGEFVADLSPTPAVCGLPKTQAKQWIIKHEPHQRDYYTGFLGAWRLCNDEVNVFVNIRCLQVLANRYRLYTGGGITAKSDVNAEWQETERKAQTLLRVIEEIS